MTREFIVLCFLWLGNFALVRVGCMVRYTAFLLFASVAWADAPLSTVKVEQAHAGGESWCGSGTVVHSAGGHSLILTNWHVIPNGDGPIRVHVGRANYPAAWIAVDSLTDLSLLRVDAELPAAKLAETEPGKGTVLRRWGFPNYRGQVEKSGPSLGCSGRVSYMLTNGQKQDGGEVYRVGVPSEQGESGSGLFDPDGRLAAVLWGGSRESCCVRLADVKRFLDKHR